MITDVELNQSLLTKAFDLVINEIKTNEIVNFFAIADIQFKEKEEQFLIKIKRELIVAIKDLKRIKVENETLPLTAISFVHADIFNLDDTTLKDFYAILKQFYDIPLYEEYIYLSKKVDNWQMPDFKIIRHEDILNTISTVSNGYYSFISNTKAYQTVIKTIAGNIELLDHIAVIPNMHGKFQPHKFLKRWENAEYPLIKTMDAINSKVSSTYLHPDFYFLRSINSYTRQEFKDDLNTFNNEKIAQLEKQEGAISLVNSVQYLSIIDSLTYFIDLNKGSEVNKNLAAFFKKVYNPRYDDSSISNPMVVINYDSTFKLLARLYVNLIMKEGESHIKSIESELRLFIHILDSHPETKKNLLDKLECFPSQSYTLKTQASLKLDLIKDKLFKTIYHNITHIEIKNELVLAGFEKYLHHSDTKTGVQLGDQIEVTLASDKKIIPIDEIKANTILPQLLELIEHISKPESEWSLWLPNINKVKEEILMYKFRDDETRSSLFSILSESQSKINLLGKLAKIDDLEDLIAAGRAKQKEEARTKQHRDYINNIGLKIQDIIQAELDSSLADTIAIVASLTDQKLITLEEQNGQDFIIYKSETPVFYIEVKSRWDIDGIIALSKRQVECCAAKQNSYAVITVNVADYKARNNTKAEDISFFQLRDDIYVNQDLGNEFNQLIDQNRKFETLTESARLIEFRGHIPQSRIKQKGVPFEKFIEELKTRLLA